MSEGVVAVTPLPRPARVRPVRKGKPRRGGAGARNGACAVTPVRCGRSGVTAGKSLLLGSRGERRRLGYGRHDSLGASRRPGSLWASFPPSSPAHTEGAEPGQALWRCVTSIEPSGDSGNMALNGTEVDDFSWEPPTEAETKVLQARRERQNRISSLMGDYLLRGYRMLGDTCADCGTILLQNKQRQTYCVACQELDSDVDKDNPALNAQAALSQAREHQLASALDAPSGSRPAPQPPVPRPEHCEGAAAGLKAAQGPAPPAVPPNADVMASTQEALLQKLTWASAELGSSTSLEASIQLCSLIRACAEALQSLQPLQH